MRRKYGQSGRLSFSSIKRAITLKKLLVGFLVTAVLIGSNVGQYFYIWAPKTDKLIANYENELTSLENTLNQIGELKPVYTVLAKTEPGQVIKQEDLSIIKLPESVVGEHFITKPAQILGRYYKVGIETGTPLSRDLVMYDEPDDTVREYDIVLDYIPIGLIEGDYIDFRITYPFGEDYIVFSHKRIYEINGKTIKVRLNEQEIHFYQAALVDYFQLKGVGAAIYINKYVEPGIQKSAEAYYAVPENIVSVIEVDPNIVVMEDQEKNNKVREMIDEQFADLSEEELEEVIFAFASIFNGRENIITNINEALDEEEDSDSDQSETQVVNEVSLEREEIEEREVIEERELREEAEGQGEFNADEPVVTGDTQTEENMVDDSNPPLEIEEGVVD
ncbi:SAF domain-containing protein [Cytobacillus sp. IB215316]|uniref:SAF domain-containing protein n=1 Tax=Cytobacillus sp. IB215316 TaxID=3097354 RepID=UPI002A0F0404|nr:SAF domain-containing protein [Cytobacillus sp. IB215316]MDX8360760.1 hypothetical protein [Cytobacillus sp. IB215316]